MEAVPRMPMLFFDLKSSPEPADFTHNLKEYIQHYYHENPESYSLELHSLESLRASAVHPQTNVEGVSMLKKYYCQLTFLTSRFPLNTDGPIRVNYVWKEAFTSKVIKSNDVRFELTCIMFNIGALHSKLGVIEERTSEDGLKLACTHFQCAAWAFQRMKDINYPFLNFSSNMLTFMVNTCLAQAQECILEKSMTDNRKSIINAKIAAQIVDFYNIALNALSAASPEVLEESNCFEVYSSKKYNGWKKYLQFKIAYYKAITFLYQGMHSEEKQKMGERLTYYQAAFERLNVTIEAAKGVTSSDITKNLFDLSMIDEALSFSMDVIEGKRKAAENENEFIYHETVPELDSLPAIEGNSLVKCISFSTNDPDISGPDIFEKLVPMKAHESSSLYSEEKAKMLRSVTGKVDEHDVELMKFMNSLQLDVISAFQSPERLPQDLVDKCAEMNSKPEAIQQLTNSMKQISDLYLDVECMLQEIKALITEEEECEKEYQEIMGSRPPSIVATDLTREMNKYFEAHKKAMESNETLHKAMTFHIANLKLLSLTPSQLEKHIPPLTDIKTAESEKMVGVIEHLVDKVEEMRRQRSMLLSQLRHGLLNDDITSQLVTRQNECLEVIFEEQLQKHDTVINLIEKNMSAQSNIINALSDAYSKYAPTRKSLNEVLRRRNAIISALLSSYDAYEDLMIKTAKGVEFYEKLGTNVSKLLTRVKGTCKVQEEERLSLLKKENKVLPRHRKTKESAVTPLSEEKPVAPASQGPKLKDYLPSMAKSSVPSYPSYTMPEYPYSVHGVRPAPVGSEGNTIEVKKDVTAPSVPPTSGYDLSTGLNNLTINSNQAMDFKSISNAYTKSDRFHPSVTSYSASGGQYTSSAPSPQEFPNSDHTKSNTYQPPQQSSTSAQYATGYDNTNTGSGMPGQQVPSPQTPSYVAPYNTHPSQNPHSIPSSYPEYQQSYPTVSSSSTPSPYQYVSPVSQHQTPTSYPSPADQQNSSQQSTYSYPYAYSQNSYYPAEQYPQQGQADSSQSNQYQTQSYGAQTSYSSPNNYYQSISSVSSTQTTPSFVNTNSSTNQYVSSTQPANAYPVNAQQTSQTTQQYPYGYSQYPATPNTSFAPQANTAAPDPPQHLPYPSPAPSPYSAYSSADMPVSYTHPAATGTPLQTQSVNQAYAEQSTGAAQSIPQQYNSYASDPHSYSQNNIQGVPSQTALSGSQPMSSGGAQQDPSVGYANPQQSPVVSQVNPSVSQPQDYNTYAMSQSYTAQYPTASYASSDTYTSYTPDQKYPTQTQMYNYNSSYSSAGHANYQATESVAYTNQNMPVTSEYYYNMPYCTQSYMQSNSSAYVNTTPSSPQVMSPNTPVPPPSGSSANISNVDLLADIDVNITHTPLLPSSVTTFSTSNLSIGSSISKESEAKSTSSMSTESRNTSANEIKAEPLNAPDQTPSCMSVVTTATSGPSLDSSSSLILKPKVTQQEVHLDTETLIQLLPEVEKFEKFVEGLSAKTLNGPTPLDTKWKEISDLQLRESQLQSISVARCYPMKNRCSDILPYDSSRVELPSTKDDYINASYIKNTSLPVIVTQSPLPSTYSDFWAMVWEQNVELIVCLLADSEMEDQIYWPLEKGLDLDMNKLKISLQSKIQRGGWIERIISVIDTEKKSSHIVVHLQMTSWPSSGFPTTPQSFLSLVTETLTLYKQQRSPTHPIVVHCSSGIGRSGLFVLTCLAMSDINGGKGLPDLMSLTINICTFRRNILKDKEHLRFAHLAVLHYAQDLLIKRGMLSNRPVYEEKRVKTHVRNPSQDHLQYGADYSIEDSSKKGHSRKSSSSSICSSSNKAELFSSQVGNLDKLSASPCPQDPLSQIDPLWPIKKSEKDSNY